jgi:UDP-N-acetylmuramoyl-tripeptide--D-alanyl-D-alanine ligase
MEKDIAKRLIINYLKVLSHIKLKMQFKGEIITLGGCFGKSSAVSLLESVFSIDHNIYTTNQGGKGLNSETGVAFAILDIHPDQYRMIDWIKYSILALRGVFTKFDHQFLILELGVDKPDDLKFLTSFIKSNVGIIINSNNTHSANFEDLHQTTGRSFEELIAYENGYIFETAHDAIVYNLDDPEVVSQTERFKGKTSIPFSTTNTPGIKTFTPTLNGTEIAFDYLGGSYTLLFDQPLLEEYRHTLEMLIKVAEYYKIKPESVVAGIKNYSLPASRCTLFKGVKGSYIIDSSYNSSFVPTTAALKLTKTISQGRTIAILGDMRELGALSEKEHRKLAHIAAENADIVITVGPMMREFFKPEFEGIQHTDQQLYSFETTKEALALVTKNNFSFIHTDDVLLIKGSQNTLFLEIIVEALLQNQNDAQKLCRRGVFYVKERAKLLA